MWCFLIPDRSADAFGDARRDARVGPCRGSPIFTRGHPDKFREPGTECSQRGEPHRETHLGHGLVPTLQEGHCALDSPCHQVGVWRLSIGCLEFPAEVPGRQMNCPPEGLHIERLGITAIHQVADLPQRRERAKPRVRGCGHSLDRTTLLCALTYTNARRSRSGTPPGIPASGMSGYDICFSPRRMASRILG